MQPETRPTETSLPPATSLPSPTNSPTPDQPATAQSQVQSTQAASAAQTDTALMWTQTALDLTPSPASSPTPIPVEDLAPFRPVAPIDLPIGWRPRLHAFGDGSVWLASSENVATFQASTGDWGILVADFPGEFIDLDAYGRVWAASEDGSQISVWSGGVWTSFDETRGWLPVPSRPVSREVVIDHLGQAWLATSQDVRVFDGDQWTVYTPEDMGMGPPEFEELMASFGVTFVESVEQIWVYECDWIGPGPDGGRGARWFDGQSWKGGTAPVANGCATAVQEDDGGNIWVGMETGLWRYTPSTDQWKHYPPPDVPGGWNRFGFVDNLTIAPNGDPWVSMALCGGASCFGAIAHYHVSGEAWTLLGEVNQDNSISHIVFDADQTPWLFTEAGAFEISADSPELVAPLYAWVITTDINGDIWLGANYEGQNYLWRQQTK
ncbi:MAG: hypothetical protein KKD28_04995 [Chloroflexi bacterium]|nr:hypothetical protein [Chloroflexota bacterium]